METSKKEKDLITQKHNRAMALRAEFIKQSTNPHLHGEGGMVFDAGFNRFQAMRVSNYQHFRPTKRATMAGFFCVVAPIAIYTWMLKAERDSREEKYRTGQVAYKDRRFKFI